jgi:transcriptional regulator
MYIPQHFRKDSVPILHELMRRHPLATVVTSRDGKLTANHVPLLLDPHPEPLGTLRGHLARANPQWQEFERDDEVLAIFQGYEHYISPSWYATKQQSGRVVPTWNYVAVHAYGRPKLFDDPERFRRFLAQLTETHEAEFEKPWGIDDAPASYIDAQMSAIIGFEIVIDRVEGKWKMSQNRPAIDQAGVAEGLESMAQLIRSGQK